jgi:hypothetical protein
MAGSRCRRPPRNRGRRAPIGAQFCEIALDLLSRHGLEWPLDARGEIEKVAAICVHGPRRPRGGQEREEAFEVRVSGRCCHPRPDFAAVGRSPA